MTRPVIMLVRDGKRTNGHDIPAARAIVHDFFRDAYGITPAVFTYGNGATQS